MSSGLDAAALLRGEWRVTGEVVSPLEHALQCAALARRDRADDDLVLAALLHDIGHLVDRFVEEPAAHHGGRGAAVLEPFVPARVAWLIEHHVVAKRYLCTVDRRYVGRLSQVSVRSLGDQGGVLTLDERLALETQPWFADAVRLRRWDDAAKDPDAVTPPLEDYRPLLEAYLGPQAWADTPDGTG